MTLINKIFPVTCHTDHVGLGSTFVAVKGYQHDGIDYIDLAIERGAKTIITDDVTTALKRLCNQKSVTLLTSNQPRVTLAACAAQKLGYPAEQLSIIGITGTKGKTTTAWLVEHMLGQAGYKTALISGVKNKILHDDEEASLTTPSSDYLQMFFARCLEKKVTHVVMEVTAHALSLFRVYGIQFSAIGFTNFDQDHLDFYETMGEYYAAKAMVFDQEKNGVVAVINRDGQWSKGIVDLVNQKAHKNDRICAFGDSTQNRGHCSFSIKRNHVSGLEMIVKKSHKEELPLKVPALFGRFNAYNVAMATLLCSELGVRKSDIMQSVQTFKGVTGRMQKHVLKNGATAFIDFAHNPLSVEAVLQELQQLTNHLIVVFGCGGDRDRDKRPKMGRVASSYADEIIITDDNPRGEDSKAIIDDILAGVLPEKRKYCTVEPNRGKAISLAIHKATPSSIIALLGKGHENYYLVGNEKKYFSDIEEIKKF